MKQTGWLIVPTLLASFACQSTEPIAGGTRLNEASGLAVVTILARGME